jgi:hypothetical protein
MWATIRNLGVFQGLWFLLVLGGDAYAIFALGWFLFHYVSYSEPQEKRLLPIYAVLGILMDGCLKAFGVYQFSNDAWPIPLWLLALWLIFPTTLSHGLRWCWSGKLLILIASAFGAALTYVGGATLGDLEFPFGEPVTVMTLTACWALYFGLIRVMTLQRS